MKASKAEWSTMEKGLENPMAAHESIVLMAIADAKEGHNIMCTDLPNVFIQTEMPKVQEGKERVVIKITGVPVDMSVQLNPQQCGPCVVCKKNCKVSCIQVLRAIHGMLQLALL